MKITCKPTILKLGFTLIELLLSISIMMILLGFSSIAYLNVQKNFEFSNQVNQLISSIRQAQIMAISGQTIDLENQLNISVHFEPNEYTIFYGDIYNPLAPTNVKISLPVNISTSNNLSGSNVIFSKITGEVFNYEENHNSITISNSNGQTNIIIINKMGVVILN